MRLLKVGQADAKDAEQARDGVWPWGTPGWIPDPAHPMGRCHEVFDSSAGWGLLCIPVPPHQQNDGAGSAATVIHHY